LIVGDAVFFCRRYIFSAFSLVMFDEPLFRYISILLRLFDFIKQPLAFQRQETSISSLFCGTIPTSMDGLRIRWIRILGMTRSDSYASAHQAAAPPVHNKRPSGFHGAVNDGIGNNIAAGDNGRPFNKLRIDRARRYQPTLIHSLNARFQLNISAGYYLGSLYDTADRPGPACWITGPI
jgi:hypothetical protein